MVVLWKYFSFQTSSELPTWNLLKNFKAKSRAGEYGVYFFGPVVGDVVMAPTYHYIVIGETQIVIT